MIFLVAVVLRALPDMLVSWYPVGYETITHYAPSMFTFGEVGVLEVFSKFFGSGPLLYVSMWLVANSSGLHPFLVLKLFGPLLYGGLAVSFLFFLKRGLKLDDEISFVAALLMIFQIAALRLSLDRFRTVLAVAFLFLAAGVSRSKRPVKWWLVSVLASLTVLSREYVVLVLFASLIGASILKRKDRASTILALSPAILIFVLTFYLTLWDFVSSYVLWAQYAPRGYYATLIDALAIFVVCYGLILPFVIKGWRKNKLLSSMVGWLLLGSISVIGPWFAVTGYNRWLILLVFPFSVYAVFGFKRLRFFENRRRVLGGILLFFIVLGGAYSAGVLPYGGFVPNSYVSVDMVESSIRWDQIEDVKATLGWIDENAQGNSSVLVEERFYGWTLIYLNRANKDVYVVPYGAGTLPWRELEGIIAEGYGWIYLLEDTDFNISNFNVIYSNDRISVFQYKTDE